MKLTEEQKTIINSKEKKILIKAGAGTGKTEVLTRRIIRLIDEDPELSITNMAVITFTNKATEELVSRLKKAFYKRWKEEENLNKKRKFRYELEALNNAQISTIHKFCQAILNSIGPFHDDDISFSPTFPILSDQLNKTIDHSIEIWLEEKMKNGEHIEHLNIMPIHKLKEFVGKTYKMIRQKGFELEKIIQATKMVSVLEESAQNKKLKKELIELVELIAEMHKKYKFDRLDVDDLLEFTAKILKKRPDLVEQIKRKYKHIFVDEFQDTSLYQTEIIKMLCDDSPDSPYLFVVGDIKQSIYEFRGADPESYLRMEQWIRINGEILSLSVNWRSTPELVAFVNHVFNNIKDDEYYHFQRDVLKPKEEKENIQMNNAYEWILAKRGEAQEDLIAQFLKEQIDNGKRPNEFTILVRKNYQIFNISEYLDKYDIPYTITDSGNFYNQEEIIQLYIVLKSILNPDHPILRKESMATMYFENDSILYKKVMNSIQENLLAYKFTPTQLLQYIFTQTKTFEKCSKKNIANINKLKEKTRETFRTENITLYQYVNWLTSMITSNVDEPLADLVEAQNESVNLMTIHKAKGLEFPVVILPFLDDDISKSSLNPPIIVNEGNFSLEFCYEKYYETGTKIMSKHYEEIVNKVQHDVYSEELRVLYVALTRAEKKLILVGNKNCNKNKICYQNWLKNNI